MSASDVDVEVLIVGGGPVGLTARALLERWGVSTALVEKRAGLSPFPRSRLINVRSMEIFRHLGVADAITAQAFAPRYGRIRFRDTLFDEDWATEGMVGVNTPIPESPAVGAVTSQDRLEPILLRAADAPVHFAVELVDLIEEPERVVATLRDQRDGSQTRFRARYVIAADGASSSVRHLLGLTTSGPGALGTFSTVVYDLDLSGWSADQPAGVYFTAHGLVGPVYPEGGWMWFAPSPPDVDDADWPSLVGRAINGDGETAVSVVQVQHWTMQAFVADHFRRGRVLLAGDSAHAIPPLGGMGMNTGVADAHNLCWKLAGVLRGWADPVLLDSYHAERHPVAQRTLRQTVTNSQLATQVLARRQERLRDGDIGRLPVELPWSEEFFAQLGLVLGSVYRSAAVLTNGTSGPVETVETGTDYRPTPLPGHRMPHIWLGPGRSTLDAIGPWFSLFTANPEGRGRIVAASGCPLRMVPMTRAQGQSCGLDVGGALLVRPDGYIAARWPDRRAHSSAVHEALRSIVGCGS